jgi:hypothetical protein
MKKIFTLKTIRGGCDEEEKRPRSEAGADGVVRNYFLTTPAAPF